jgi:hypothetical protein
MTHVVTIFAICHLKQCANGLVMWRCHAIIVIRVVGSMTRHGTEPTYDMAGYTGRIAVNREGRVFWCSQCMWTVTTLCVVTHRFHPSLPFIIILVICLFVFVATWHSHRHRLHHMPSETVGANRDVALPSYCCHWCAAVVGAVERWSQEVGVVGGGADAAAKVGGWDDGWLLRRKVFIC